MTLASKRVAGWVVVAAVVGEGCVQQPQPKPFSQVAPTSSAAAVLPSATASAKPVSNISPTPPRLQMQRALIAELACEAEVFRVGARTLVGCGQDVLVPDQAQGLRREPALSVGLGLDASELGGRHLAAIAGEWPEAAWAETVEVSGGGNSNTLRFFRWRKDRWVATGKSAELGGPEARVVFAWTADGLGMLAAKAFEATRFFAFSGKPVTVPALTPAKQTREAAQQYPCRSVMIAPEQAVQLSPGDVMVFSGQMCAIPGSPNDDSRMGVERLRAGQKQGEVTALPLPSDLPAGVIWNVDAAAALGPSEVLVAASGFDSPTGDQPTKHFAYLGRYDGGAWHVESAPFQRVSGLWAFGSTFAACDAKAALWLRRGSAWETVEWANASTDAWSRAPVTQIVEVEGAIWLVQQAEQRPGPTASRVYRITLP